MTRVIACREVLSTGTDEVLVYDRWGYYYSGEQGAKVIGTLHRVPGGWQAETAGPRPMTMPMRRSRLRAAQDVLDHHTGDCTCTPTGWVCCHGPVPPAVFPLAIEEHAESEQPAAEPVTPAEPQRFWDHQRHAVARLLSPGKWWDHPGGEEEKARALAKADEVIAVVLGRPDGR